MSVSRADPFWGCFAVCAAAAMIPIWSVKYLPMVDLPQHAAQISMWKHYDDPAFGFAEQVEFNILTPYLLAYCLARLLSTVLSVAAAWKGVISLAVGGRRPPSLVLDSSSPKRAAPGMESVGLSPRLRLLLPVGFPQLPARHPDGGSLRCVR
jgi:hypothetical protein